MKHPNYEDIRESMAGRHTRPTLASENFNQASSNFKKRKRRQTIRVGVHQYICFEKLNS